MEILIIAALVILAYVVYRNLDKASPIKIVEATVKNVAAEVEKTAETAVEVTTEATEVVAKTATKTSKSIAKKAESIVEDVVKEGEVHTKKPRAPRKPKMSVAK